MELEEGRRMAEFRRQESESRLRRLQKQQARWGVGHGQSLRWGMCRVLLISVCSYLAYNVLLIGTSCSLQSLRPPTRWIYCIHSCTHQLARVYGERLYLKYPSGSHELRRLTKTTPTVCTREKTNTRMKVGYLPHTKTTPR